MLIPGKLYRFDLGNTVCTFYALSKDNVGYKRVGFTETVTYYNTLHLYLGVREVSYGSSFQLNEMLFIINDNKIIARSISDERYMVLAC